MKLKPFITRNILLLFVFVGYGIFSYLTGVTCVLKKVFQISCPTCGVTRALYAAVNLDLGKYLDYNAMAIPLLIVVWLSLNVDYIPKKKAVRIFAFAVLAVNTVYYIIRMVTKVL